MAASLEQCTAVFTKTGALTHSMPQTNPHYILLTANLLQQLLQFQKVSFQGSSRQILSAIIQYSEMSFKETSADSACAGMMHALCLHAPFDCWTTPGTSKWQTMPHAMNDNDMEHCSLLLHVCCGLGEFQGQLVYLAAGHLEPL